MKKRPPQKTPCPDGRISKSTTVLDGREVLDTNAYIPHFFSTINGALSWGASNVYRARFSIGIIDWRVLSMLAIEPGCEAHRVSELLSIDKAAISRSLQKLNELGYLLFETSQTDPRKRTWQMSDEGYALHHAILQIAVERERVLIEGVDSDELEVFLKVARQMRQNVRRLA